MPICRHRVIWIAIVALAGPTLWLVADDQPTAGPDHKPVASPGNGSLLGKSLAITIKSDPSYSTYLQHATLSVLGTSHFLVGDRFDNSASDKSAGRRVWVAIDDISEIIEFETTEELEQFLEQQDDRPDA
ncbi:MAG: hypothetical protein ACK5Q5_22965 [Planctomycetaceae bacterium]